MIEHKQYIAEYGEERPGNLPLKWGANQRRQTGVSWTGARVDVHYAKDPK